MGLMPATCLLHGVCIVGMCRQLKRQVEEAEASGERAV
jgi:hypothetical protein